MCPIRSRAPRSVFLVAVASLWGTVLPVCAQATRSRLPHSATDSITIRTGEGTALGFDLTPDGRTIIFDLLGQLWSLPVQGGTAVPLTDAVSDIADDSDPSVSPDGAWIVFRSDRPQGRGLWLKSLVDGKLRQLTDSTYFVNNEHSSPSWAADNRRVAYVNRWRLRVRDIVTHEDTVLRPPQLPRFVTDAIWSPDGTRVLVVSGDAYTARRLWEIDLRANLAEPFDSTRGVLQSPSYAPDGSQVAYFAENRSSGTMQLWVSRRGQSIGRLMVEDQRLSPLRARWSPDGQWLYYSADGKLWRMRAEGGTPSQIPFTATLSFARAQYPPHTMTVPSPGQTIEARGFSGLALAPEGRRYAIIALGKLWVAEVGRRPRPVRTVPTTAFGLSWSPDGTRVVWSAGRGGTENLFATEVRSGETRQLTALPGRESLASWSPDGRWIAFVHWTKPESDAAPWAPDTTGSRIRIIEADRSAPARLSDTRDLGPFYSIEFGHNRLNWNATSSAVLTFTNQSWPVANADSAKAVWLGLDGSKQLLTSFPYRPSFTHVGRDGALTYVQDGLLWRTSPTGGEPQALSRTASLYPSVATDGTVLFASEQGLRILRNAVVEEQIGWPFQVRVPEAPTPLLIRNASIFDGSGAVPEGQRDILIENGRIRRIEKAGRIRSRRSIAELDAAGRTVIPGLMDVHAHLTDPAVLPAALYFGVTTVREVGSPLSVAVDRRDAVRAGTTHGPRIIVSGLSFYPSPTTGGLTSDVNWMPRDSATMERGLGLLRSFGAEHVKLRFPLTFASGAMFVRLSRANGFTISGHCANPLSLVVAGISGQEHLDGQCLSRSTAIGYEDRAQLYRAAGLWGVPTVFLHGAHARAVRDTSVAHHPEIEPFLTPRLRLMMFVDQPGEQNAINRFRQGEAARIGTRWFHQAGLPIVLGADTPEFPDAVHGELAELVAAGLTPAEALVAATSAAADVLGIGGEVGRIAIGKIADLVLLDADPLIDIRNTRRIWRVIQGGRAVDRNVLRSIAKQGL